MWDQKPCFTLEIGNFSNKETVIASNVFEADGCEWYLSVHPKGVSGRFNGHLCLLLNVANRKSLRTGWRRSAKFYFRVLSESNKELYRSPTEKSKRLFCAWNPTWGFRKILPLSKFQEEGFLEKDQLIIEVYIKVVEAFDGEGGDVPENKKQETVDINGFQVFAAYVASVKKIFAEHVVKTEYKNTLSKACRKLSELVEVGFKLDWLRSKFDELSLKKKADGVDESLVQQQEERIKNLELMVSGFNKDCLNSKLKDSTLDADESRVQKLEESVKNLELMELGFKLDRFKSKLEEISLEKKKAYDASESRTQLLEGRVKNIELMETGYKLDSLKLKLEEISLGRKKSCDASESRAQQLEERIKNVELLDLGLLIDCLNSTLDDDESRVQQLEERLKDLEGMKVGSKLDCLNTKIEENVKNTELVVSSIKVELDKKKDKSTADGFLLVN
ncbi:MATH domain and coiled-coil domain-containing protein At2g42475-like [Raphanus sativus]|uniref:MATH domain and coiled-coil domain-containing protein At2g42475-like n=1 Tax=Raphanus sativus TaxID=3726 RepID=A0A9W3BXF4_RAPSA|nr:MATH domain and coiled-coil domain-containing protein At2g42475-like [Raphanus sativus]